MDRLASEALKNKNLEFVLNGYRNKKISGSGETAANSLSSLMVSPPCAREKTCFLN